MVRNIVKPDIGDNIKIICKDKDIKYSSQLLDKIDNNIYVISGPIHKNTLIPLSFGVEIIIEYFKENSGRFVFKAKIIKRESKKLYKLYIKKIGNINKLQERDYYRLSDMLKVKKIIQDSNNIDENDEEKCVTEDISGNGMKILSDCIHKHGDIVLCKIFIEEDIIQIVGQIVRFEKTENKKYNYALGIKFTEINNNDRQKIIKYIFTQQRKLRKKGLI